MRGSGYVRRVKRQKNTADPGGAPAAGARSVARGPLRDASSQDLVQLAKKLGNDQVRALVGQAADKRDALLAFVERRLAQVRAVQHAEQESLAEHREWFRRAGRREHGFTLPDPTRWRHATQIYRRATDALCGGDLGRGAQLLEQAVAAERAAFASVPKQVDIPDATRAPAAAPEACAQLEEGDACPPTHAPGILHAADAIIRVTETAPALLVPATSRTHRWWEVAEVEEATKKAEKKGAEQAEAGARGAGAVGAERRASGAAQAPERAVDAPGVEAPGASLAAVSKEVGGEVGERPVSPKPRKGRASDGR